MVQELPPSYQWIKEVHCEFSSLCTRQREPALLKATTYDVRGSDNTQDKAESVSIELYIIYIIIQVISVLRVAFTAGHA